MLWHRVAQRITELHREMQYSSAKFCEIASGHIDFLYEDDRCFAQEAGKIE
jgi:hypothetical protein